MNSQTKKCPLCAEQIPLEETICKYCGAKFEIKTQGYCTLCHELRETDGKGLCKVCKTKVADLQVESKLIEEPALKPAPAAAGRVATPSSVARVVPSAQPASRKKTTWLWILLGVGGLMSICIAGGIAGWFMLRRAPAESGEVSSGLLAQWAVSATASSEYGEIAWTAEQATGAPDTFTCGDLVTAWASKHSLGVDWLEVGFASPVVPTRIDIYESYKPSSIIKVEVRDISGSYRSVWEGEPQDYSECPRVFAIPLSDIDFKVAAVKISLDQSVIGGWNEIDAVQLIGTP